MSVYLKREGQFGIELQAAAGVAESLAAADYSQNSSDLSAGVKLPQYERSRYRGALSKDGPLGRAKMQTIQTTEELVGVAKTTGASDALISHRIFRACGLKRQTAAVKVVDVGTVTVGSGSTADLVAGRRIGDNATEGSATKTGMLVAYKAGSPGKLWYIPGTGTFADTDTIHVYDAPAQSMPCDSAPADAGYEFRPLTEGAAASNEFATVACVTAGNLFMASDAMGDLEITANWNEPVKLKANFMGPFVPASVSSNPNTAATSSPIASVPVVGGALAVAIGVPYHIDRKFPVCTTFSLKLGNTVAERRAIGSGAAQNSGYAGARISERQVTFSMDPEKPALAGEDYLKKLAGRTTFPVAIQVGDPADANGALVIFVPAAQLTGDYGEQERDGIVTVPLEGMATGTADDEVRIFHIAV